MKNPEAMGERLGAMVRDHVARELAPLCDRLAALEARNAETMAFKGTWQGAQRYQRGDLAIADGQLWYALRGHEAGEQKPGESGSSGWTMIGRTR